MHVLVVNQYALPRGASGITRHGDLGAELVSRGHRVTIIASRFNYLTRETNRRDRSVEAGVEFRWVDAGSYTTNDTRRVRSMVSFSARAMIAGLKLRPMPDVVVGSSPHLLAGLVARILATVYRVPFIFEIRDLWPSVLVELGALSPRSRVYWMLERLEKYLYREASRIIVVPPGAGKRVKEMGESDDKCIHIPNATLMASQESLPLPQSLDSILYAERERDIVIYSGAHGVSNDLGTVLKAMAYLRQTDPVAYQRVAILFIGNGAERARLQALSALQGHTHVHFFPPIPKAILPAALERAAFFLVSFAHAGVYRYGVSPNKLFDYMAIGRPVLLASQAADNPVQRFEAGYTYTPGDHVSLAERIVKVLSLTPHERATMGERGRRAVRDHFTVPVTASMMESVLGDAIAARAMT